MEISMNFHGLDAILWPSRVYEHDIAPYMDIYGQLIPLYLNIKESIYIRVNNPSLNNDRLNLPTLLFKEGLLTLM